MMWRVLVAVWVAAMLVSAPLGGQEGTSVRSIGLSLRGDYFASQDLLISPRVHDGLGVSQGGVLFSVEGPSSSHELDVWFGSMGIEADGGFTYLSGGRLVRTPDSKVSLGDASYTYLRRLGASQWWVGGAGAVEIADAEYELGAGSVEGFLYSGALQVAGRRDIDLDRGRSLSFSLRVPLLAWTARPPFSTVDEERLQTSNDFFHRVEKGGVSWPGDFRGAWARAGYEQVLNRYLGFRGAVRVGYVRHTGTERFTSLRAGLDLGLMIRWAGGDR